MLPYQDAGLPIEQRLDDLLKRMTTEEKILQTDQYFSHDITRRDENEVALTVDMDKLHQALRGHSAGSFQLRNLTARQANQIQRYAVERTRLGIPFLFSEEALHGVHAARATSFPQQIGLAATFHPELGCSMGRAIAAEARSMGIHETFSPVMDLMRDPRYGRTEESFGEDTYLCSCFAKATVRGMQGDDLTRPDAIAAEPKHYVGYGNPVGGLNCAPSTMGRHDAFAECLPVFEAAFIEGGALNAMCSYNAIDGIPVSMDHELLTDVLRGQYGMRGFVRSDLTAILRLHGSHYITPTRREAIAVSMRAGVDLQLYDYPHAEWQEGIAALLASGELPMAALDQACRRVLRVKFLLGLFENPYTDEALESSVVRCEEHRALALDIARQSICLLKNKAQLLPLSKTLKRVAVLGPLAGQAALGDYTETRGRTGAVSVLEGIEAIIGPDTVLLHEAGCNVLGDLATPFDPIHLTAEDGAPGLTGRYYNGPSPQGTPVVTRTDPTVNFNWIFQKPDPALDAHRFSAVWTGTVSMPEAFTGCIGLNTSDSMRLYIDGQCLIDGWGADQNANQMVDFTFEAGRAYAVRIEFVNDQRGARVIFGYNHGREQFQAAVRAARSADVAIVCLGDNTETSGENFDRTDLNLPGNQLPFLKAIYETGTPVVLVLQSGRPVSAAWEQAHIPAILQAWFPGEMGGHAIAQTLFGDNEPSGRLPISFPRSVGQIPCHYSRKPGGGQRYVEMTWNPLYPFGYGLSYTTFSYTNVRLSADRIQAGDSVSLTFEVTNTGKRGGVTVPQVYLRDCFASVVKPMQELAAFQRVELQAGQTRTVRLTVSPREMRTLNPQYQWSVEPGDFEIMLGDHSDNILWQSRFTVQD